MSDRFATDARARRLRRGGLGALIAVCALSLAAPLALADRGDKTLAISEFGADLKTNQCPGASLTMAITGAPEVPDDYDIYIGSGYSSCTERVRFFGIKGDGHTAFRTKYVYAPDGSENVLPVDNVYRCYVEFGVRRKNGTYFTRFILPDKPEVDTCPD